MVNIDMKVFRRHGEIAYTLSRTVAFTGHRPNRIGGYGKNPTADAIYKHIHDFILIGGLMNDFKYNTFISGMALGVDTIAAKAVLDCRDNHNLPVRLIAALPYGAQNSRWPAESTAE